MIDSIVPELAETITKSREVLVSATTVFPFTLFPDAVTLDRAKLTIAHREFFAVGEVVSIRIEDILNVMADVGPFLGSLKIFTRFFSTDKPYQVSFLRRQDALRIKRILQGYIIAIQKKIDCSALPTPELARMLDDLGQ
ncbi:MAG TPA: hypothetical protein VK674_02590 [Candidatus Limnocylindria bacterium]|nr:hypothetical protein [Candidatus Limnocylindria bacterium]